MARIVSSTPEKIVTIKKFKGLNENQGGDTKLALGEASVCTNWRVTRDGNLQRRPGYELVGTLSAGKPVKGIWSGWVNGKEYLLAACNGKLYMVYNGATGLYPCSVISSIDTTNRVHFFGFASKVYILNGAGYYSWDGTTFASVTGYVPLVATAIGPHGTAEEAGELLEQVNKLNAYRRVWISPDGSNSQFDLPEHPVSAVTAVIDLSDESTVDPGDYTVNVTDGTVTFDSPPAVGTNSYEIQYTATTSYSTQVTKMQYSELFSGTMDNRVFLYGDGSNKLIYSDIDYYGVPRADYFPDMNEIAVGDANTPVTGAIRHFSRLICYKSDSTWSIAPSTSTLADGTVIAAFYLTPVNRSIGNVAPGQVELVLNSPRTLFNHELYQWKSSNAYSGNLTSDERQAIRISDRIYNSLRSFTLSGCICFDDNSNQEYYIAYNDQALVHNYAVDAWYHYNHLPATGFASLFGTLFFGTEDGDVCKFVNTAKNDYDADADNNVVPIEALWQSGAMDFGAEYSKKYSSNLWIAVKPETNSYVEIDVITDNRDDYASRTIAMGTSGFLTWDFRSFSFADNTQPRVKKIRMKAKKFQYYRLIFYSNNIDTTATILSADIRTRQTGYAK